MAYAIRHPKRHDIGIHLRANIQRSLASRQRMPFGGSRYAPLPAMTGIMRLPMRPDRCE